MRKNCYWILYMMAAVLLFGGCGKDFAINKAEREVPEIETEQETELKEMYLSAEEDADVPTLIEVFSEDVAYPALAEFLVDYYEIPQEDQDKTRYYYNYVDLNDDGLMEIFAMVVENHRKQDSGYPAVILSVGETGEFVVVEAFESVYTPVTISEQKNNGWHDIIYYAYGAKEKDGYRIHHYDPEGGYQTEASEIVSRLDSIGGTQILSNNLIDDMDQGRYLALAPQMENTTD